MLQHENLGHQTLENRNKMTQPTAKKDKVPVHSEVDENSPLIPPTQDNYHVSNSPWVETLRIPC